MRKYFLTIWIQHNIDKYTHNGIDNYIAISDNIRECISNIARNKETAKKWKKKKTAK